MEVMGEHHTFCRICNAMCGLVVSRQDENIVRVRGDESHPISAGYTCAKGRAAGEVHHDLGRLNFPLLGRGELRREVSWDELISDLGSQLRDVIDQHGPQSVAMYLASGSAFDTAGRRAAERFLSLLPSPQKYTATTIDTPCKPLVAELVGGWSGLTPIWDWEHSTLLLLFGSNPVVSHGHSNAIPDPIRKIREFQQRGGELIVFDPRKTETANLANEHFQLRPGSDWLVLAWLVKEFLEHPLSNAKTQSFSPPEKLRKLLSNLDIDFVAAQLDCEPERLHSLVTTIRQHGRISALTGTGTSMSAPANVTEYLLWVLVAITDSLDRRGGMWFNPGMFFQMEKRRFPANEPAPLSGPPSWPELPRRFDEWPCVGLLSEIEAGNVKALFVIGGNPALAFPETTRTMEALSLLSLLAVADIYPTETTEIATHILPSVDQFERSDITWLLDCYQLAIAGQYTDAIVAPKFERKPVWWSLGAIAEKLGIELFRQSFTELSESDLLEPLLERSRVGAQPFRDATTAIVGAPARYEWVLGNLVAQTEWNLEPPELIAELGNVVASITNDDATVRLQLIPHRRLRMMNSQLAPLSVDTVDEIAIRIHPETARQLNISDRAVVTTEFGRVEGPVTFDDRLRKDTVTLSHGSLQCNVSELTSSQVEIDPLTGMVWQSGIECEIQPSPDTP